MNKVTESFSAHNDQVHYSGSTNYPLTRFYVEKFIHYGHDDPSGLCDGGDYVQSVQVRLEEDGTIFVSLTDRERSDTDSQHSMSYDEFYRRMTNAFRRPAPKQITEVQNDGK